MLTKSDLTIGAIIEWQGERGIIIPDPLMDIPESCAGDPEIVCIAWTESHRWDRYALHNIRMAVQRGEFRIC